MSKYRKRFGRGYVYIILLLSILVAILFNIGGSRSIFGKIFIVDFRKPLTIVQAQFPATIIYHDLVIKSIINETGAEQYIYEDEEEDWTKEIHFVDYNGNETQTVDGSKGGQNEIGVGNALDEGIIGEIEDVEEGIFVIGEDDIIDSLSFSKTDLNKIEKPKSIAIESGKPSILIYHTHGTESYKPVTEGNYHSLKKEYTVIAVAEIMTKELEKKGFNVIHSNTYHDYPSYNGAYGRSAVTVKSILENNPSIKVVLDLHRDGFDKIDTRADKLKLIENSRIKINGEYAARFQFVIGAATKNKKEVESFANFVKAVSDNKYPGFSKDILVKQYGSYNQFLSNYATLVELGSNANTIEEAKLAGYYLADILGEALKLLSK